MRLALVLALLPAPALAEASAECSMTRACWDGTCQPLQLAMTLQPVAEAWELAWQQGAIRMQPMLDGDDGDTLVFHEPLTQGQTSLFTWYPSGEAVLTQHRPVDGKVQVATFTGICSGDAG